mmetsp:Transcript_53454/g.153373  ORF Transcript_53454/g.153373 Transcript_53454/m.153373 type:complete len:228 (+) Transcript_53454:1105-1788(+)
MSNEVHFVCMMQWPSFDLKVDTHPRGPYFTGGGGGGARGGGFTSSSFSGAGAGEEADDLVSRDALRIFFCLDAAAAGFGAAAWAADLASTFGAGASAALARGAGAIVAEAAGCAIRLAGVLAAVTASLAVGAGTTGFVTTGVATGFGLGAGGGVGKRYGGTAQRSHTTSVSYSSLTSKPPLPNEWRTTPPLLATSQSKTNSNCERSWPSQFVAMTHEPEEDWLNETQ